MLVQPRFFQITCPYDNNLLCPPNLQQTKVCMERSGSDNRLRTTEESIPLGLPKDVVRFVGMGTFYDFYPGLGFDFCHQAFHVGAMIYDTGP